MWWDPSLMLPGPPAPWSADPQRFLDHLHKQIPSSLMGLAILNSDRPRPDEVLLAQGWPRKSVEWWCGSDPEGDRLLRAARRTGLALARRQETAADRGMPGCDHLMLAMVCESLPLRRWWLLLLGRAGPEFTPVEQKLAGLLLRQTQAAFDRADEPGMCRLLIGHDDRLIHADPGAQIVLLHHPRMLADLIETLRDVVPQRWPDLEDSAGHDLAAQLDGQGAWVCFYRRRAIDADEAGHWYVETRRLEPGELPVVGKLADGRIAQALGYMHDNFHQSPSLAQIARTVHVSPFHFHRLFSRLVGLSPKQYLQHKQLQAAKWMLRNTRTPIRSVALRAGFSSHGHFTSTFHRLVGAIPSQYRERH